MVGVPKSKVHTSLKCISRHSNFTSICENFSSMLNRIFAISCKNHGTCYITAKFSPMFNLYNYDNHRHFHLHRTSCVISTYTHTHTHTHMHTRTHARGVTRPASARRLQSECSPLPSEPESPRSSRGAASARPVGSRGLRPRSAVSGSPARRQ